MSAPIAATANESNIMEQVQNVANSASQFISNLTDNSATTQNKTPSLAPMLEKVLPAVVTINVSGEEKSQGPQLPDEFKFFFGDTPFTNSSPQQFTGLGSGVIIDAQKGYVVTNNHVIANASKIDVELRDGRVFKAKVLGTDPQSDLALLQLDDPKNLTAIKIANSNNLKIGDFAVAIGNPFGLGQTVTAGIISALGRSTGEGDSYENFIQTDAAVNRGNSGGPLINLNGELIGINTAIIAPNGGNVGIAFAIPSNMTENIVRQIIDYGEVRRGILGIKGTELNADLAKAFNLKTQKGAFVSEVIPNSAAAKSGLKAGDIIISVNKQKINSFAELRALIATAGAGQKVQLTYLRDGTEHTIDVTLQSSDGVSSLATDNVIQSLKGVTLDNYSKGNIHGVEVKTLTAGSLAERQGLKVGDIIIGVNRDKVNNLKELTKVLNSKPAVIALNIVRDNNNFYLLIPQN